MVEFEELKQIIFNTEQDLQKAEGGNLTAGVRVRKAMQILKDKATIVRKKIVLLRPSNKED